MILAAEGALEAERQEIATVLTWDQDIERCISNAVQWYEQQYQSGQDIGDMVFDIIIDLMLKLRLPDDIQNTKGYVISYLFGKKTYNLGVVSISWLDAYVKNELRKETVQELLIYDTWKERELSDTNDMDYAETCLYSDIERRYENNYRTAEYEEYDENDENDESRLGYNEATVIINDFTPRRLDDYKLQYFWDQDRAEEMYQDQWEQKLRKWHRYCNNDDFYIRHVGGEFRSKNILITNRIEDFDDVLQDSETESYMKDMITANLSERDSTILDLSYWRYLPPRDVAEQMGYISVTSLAKARSKAIGKLRTALPEDYEHIVYNFDGTKLCYWAKKISTKYYQSEGQYLANIQ